MNNRIMRMCTAR